MGTEATEREAEVMLGILEERGFVPAGTSSALEFLSGLENITESAWLDMIEEALEEVEE